MALTVEAELLKAQSDSFGQYADELIQKISNVEDAINTLTAAVHGTASTSCYNQFELAKQAMLSYVPKLQDVQARLASVAQTNIELDEGLGNSLHIEETAV